MNEFLKGLVTLTFLFLSGCMPDNYYPLIDAAKNNNMIALKQLVDKGADTNQKGGFGYTALIEASGKGNLDIVKFLIANGSDVNTTAYSGYSALHSAATHGKKETAAFLIDNGAKINAKTKFDDIVKSSAS